MNISMKYNININQKALSVLGPEMDILDAAILEYIKSMCNSVSEKISGKRIEDDKGVWTWIDLGTLITDMPLLRLSLKSKGALARRVKKIESCGFVTTMRRTVKSHIRLFFKLEAKINELDISSHVAVEEQANSLTLLQSNVHVAVEKRETDSHVAVKLPIINTSNINNKTSILEKFEEFWKVYPRRVAKSNAEKAWLKIKPDLFGIIIADVIKRKSSDRQWQHIEYIPHAATYLNAGRWTDDIIPASSPGVKQGVGEVFTKGKFDGVGKEINKN